MTTKTAIIIVSHNSKQITNNLYENITAYTKTPHDIIIVETGSKLNELSDYYTIVTKEGIRGTRGFNMGIDYALKKEIWSTYPDSKEQPFTYDFFWCLVNDSKLFKNIDTLTPMIEFMRNNSDCGMIHPYIDNALSDYLKKSNDDKKARKSSFVEIICPLISRQAILNCNMFDDIYYYMWGLDYSFGYKLYQQNLRLYISNEVGVIHDAGTTTKSGKDENFKSMSDQFNISRDNMIKGLTIRYGNKWAKTLVDNIPIDVPREPLIDWLVNVGCNCKMEDLV